MAIEIRRLGPDLLADWLYFFDHTVACDGNEWSGCYCMAPHWSRALQAEKEWEYSEAGAARNRACAQDSIEKGILQGYLAYRDGKAIGWCNANDKRNYDSIFFHLPGDSGGRIKAIACFFIAPDCRGEGVATMLLEKLCADAQGDGYACVEAYPFVQDKNQAFTGPLSMYAKNGFAVHDDSNDIAVVFRKYL